jgi:helix-turn-helix protein
VAHIRAAIPERRHPEVTDDNTLLDGFLTEEQAARELRRNSRTLRRWRDLREGPPWVRLGRQVLYRREAVRAWLLSREKPL